MRMMVPLLAAVPLAGCATAAMNGFDKLAAQGGERIDITAIPAWQDGSFALGVSQGQVRRRAVGDRQAWSDDPWATVSQAIIARTGTFTFTVAGPEIGGRIEGRCRYGRLEGEDRIGDVATSSPLRPLRLGCRYVIDGRDAGDFELHAAPPEAPIAGEVRNGRILLDGTSLAVHSTMNVAGTTLPMDSPVGYTLQRANGVTVGAIETVGGGRRRLIVPHDPAERRAVLAATLTLALFWDPGDVD